VENPKDLSPLAKGDLEIGKALPFPIYDRHGVLLLAAGQSIATSKQLDELASKGLYQNPRWSPSMLQSRQAKGTVKPGVEIKSALLKHLAEEPSETGASLKMNLIGQAEVFPVKLVGAHGREAFVVSHPMRDGSCIFTKEGQNWEFRSFYGLSVYHFTAMIEKVLLSPHPLLVMSWPQEQQLEFTPIRSTRRVACEVPATVRVNADDVQPRNAVVLNLSTGGVELKLTSGGVLAVGVEILLAFQLQISGRKYLFELPARVVTHHGEQGAKNSYGLAFNTLKDSDFAAIHAFVCERLVLKLESPLYSAGNS
jgi:hypothetical protein